MILITSAAYASAALISEFGKLPPAMLPVQNRRLYYHQLQLIDHQHSGKVYLTLPNDFEPAENDKVALEENHVEVIKISSDFSLGQSVVYALNVIGRYDEPLYILHGDTLFSDLSWQLDIYAVSKAEDDYAWSAVQSGDKDDIYTGFFSFSSTSLLIRKIAENGYHFIDGVNAYQKELPMMGIHLKGWMDFGLINSYYRSVSRMTTQRVFNSLVINRYSLTKYSKDSRKILAEANWFNSLPKPMRHYAPALWDSGITEDGRGFYEIEYYYQSSLANLFVFGRNPLFVWEEILNSCAEYLADEYTFAPNDKEKTLSQNAQLYGAKTIHRLKKYAKDVDIDLNKPWTINGLMVPSLMTIAAETDAAISKNDPTFVTLMHGDLCLSNILYDFKSRSIRVIDPRGLDLEGNQSIWGDFRYDVAKLAHSILGMYDYIIGGNFVYSENDKYDVYIQFARNQSLIGIQDYFKKMHFAGFSLDDLSSYPIMIHLFLSMLPLHSDNPSRQKAFLANALRLYVEYKKHC